MEPTTWTAQPVRVVETHISVLLFFGDRVYKLHKPVRFDFLDFTDREARATDCHREVELNRRLAPDVYLGVADLVMDGTPIDHMVVMRALPEDRQLAALLRSGEVAKAVLDQIAAVLASFHAAATRSAEITASASSAELAHRWQENFDEVGRLVDNPLDAGMESEIRLLVDLWLGSHQGLLEERMAQGFICDGHGDLQASDIYCLEDGVRILDCLEFSDLLRWGDVCADVAFLVMDLERLGHPEAARAFVDAYEHHSGHRLPPSLLHLHVALRAYIRAKVGCLRSAKTDTASEPVDLQALALIHLRAARSALVLIGGLPGTGKSTLAAALARETGWRLLRSDEVRQARPADDDRYAPASRAAVYEDLLEIGRADLAQGRSVILDASWSSAQERDLAAQVAAETGVELLTICCRCDASVGATRIKERLAQGADPSEATVAVRDAMRARFDPWPSAVVVDTSRASIDATLEAAFVGLASALPSAVGLDPSGPEGTKVPASRGFSL